MQQLEIVYRGIKGAILVRKSSGPTTEELPLFNLKKKKKKGPIYISFPFKVCKAVTLYCHCYSQLICL